MITLNRLNLFVVWVNFRKTFLESKIELLLIVLMLLLPFLEVLIILILSTNFFLGQRLRFRC